VKKRDSGSISLTVPESSTCFAGTKREQCRAERVPEKGEGGGDVSKFAHMSLDFTPSHY